MKFTTYLFFDGKCREAFEFYKSVFGGVIPMQMTYGQAPAGAPISPGSEDKIMHIRMDVGGASLLGSDDPGPDIESPSGFRVVVNVDTPEEAEKVFAGLSAGGSVTQPLSETFFAKKFAMLKDKYGIGWMVICEKPMG